MPPLVLVLAGQSDMVGRGAPDQLPDELVEQVGSSGQFLLSYDLDRLAKEGANSVSEGFLPLKRDAQWSSAGRAHTHGPEWGVVRALLESGAIADGRRVYLIKFAMGSSSLHEHWNADGRETSHFSACVDYVKRMLERVGELEADAAPAVSAMLWLQGHSDASGRAEMRERYRENFGRLVSEFRRELGAPELPVVASQLTWECKEGSKGDRKFRRQMQVVNVALQEACESDLGSAAYSSFDEATEARMTCREDGHSDTGGLLLLGDGLGRVFVERFSMTK